MGGCGGKHEQVPAANGGTCDHEPAAGGRKYIAGHRVTQREAGSPCEDDVSLSLPHAVSL